MKNPFLNLLTHHINVAHLKNFLEKNLISSDEPVMWRFDEIKVDEKKKDEKPLFTVRLATISRYINLKVSLSVLEFNGYQATHLPYFTLDQALDIRQEMIDIFRPLPVQNHAVVIIAKNDNDAQDYQERIFTHHIEAQEKKEAPVVPPSVSQRWQAPRHLGNEALSSVHVIQQSCDCEIENQPERHDNQHPEKNRNKFKRL